MSTTTDNSGYIHLQGWLDGSSALEYFATLFDQIPWTKKKWRGKNLPRDVYSYGMDGTIIPLELLAIDIASAFCTKVSSIWCNRYTHGAHYTPYHQDKYGCDIITLSLGATRKFSMRRKSNRSGRVDFQLVNGDVFYFTQEVNDEWEHTITKTKKDVGPRISLVFFVDEPLVSGL